MVKLGFDSDTEQGPGIFLYRLQQTLSQQGRFSADKPDVWIQLSFQTLPDAIERRVKAGRTKVLVRMNGCYCSRYHLVQKPVVIPLPLFDTLRSKKVNQRKNAQIFKNLHSADGIVFQSHFSKRLTYAFVCKTPPGSIIYNGVPLDTFSPEGPVRQDWGGRLNLLMSHSFRPFHRLHDGMRILAQAKKTLTPLNPHLHIVGGDDESGSFDYARQVADGLGLIDTVDYTFWGKVSFEELPMLYRSCDLMLNLSYWDACPNVVVEAMACGVPVVGVRHGGVAELVEDAGILVHEPIPFTYLSHMDFRRMPKAPVNAYVIAIEHAFMNRQALQEKALARVQRHFDIRHIAQQYVAVAEAIAASASAVPV